MIAFCKKHSTLILVLFLITMLILSWFIPAERLFLGIVFVLFSFGIASIAIVEKQKEACRHYSPRSEAEWEGRITRGMLIRNALLEITGTGLAMLLAALLGREAAHAATQQIGGDLVRVIAGILVGLVVGIGVGTLARKIWGRLVKIPSET